MSRMWLETGLIFPVKRCTARGAKWFEIDGVPKELHYGSIGDWLSEECDETLVKGAKLVGIHDQDELLSDDPRFNHRRNEPFEDDTPGFVVLHYPKNDGRGYLGALMVNTAETHLFRYMLRYIYPNDGDSKTKMLWEGVPGEWLQNTPSVEQAYRTECADSWAYEQERAKKAL